MFFPEKFIQYYVVSQNVIPIVTIGPLAWIYELYFGLYFFLSFFFLARTFFKSFGRSRAQIAAGLMGLLVGTGGASFTNLVLPIHFGLELIWLGPIFGVIGITSFSYMLFGVQEDSTRLFPIGMLGTVVAFVLGLQMVTAQSAEEIILNGAILSGIVVLVIFLIRDTLLEAADVRRFQDVSRRLQRVNEELKRSDRVKSEFLAIVSHHLRTPLTHIKWALTELAQGDYGGKLVPPQRKLTKELLANNERLVTFIDSLMDTSHIEAGQIQLHKERVDVQKLLRDVTKNFVDQAKHYYRVEIDFIPATEVIPKIVADRGLLRKVFENIIENALIYNKVGGRIYIKMQKEKEMAIVEITDTGIGIPAEDLSRVGEKFFRSSIAKRDEAEGTGLGVFIAQQILLLHGGSLKVESREGEGTTVTVTLPTFSKERI